MQLRSESEPSLSDPSWLAVVCGKGSVVVSLEGLGEEEGVL